MSSAWEHRDKTLQIVRCCLGCAVVFTVACKSSDHGEQAEAINGQSPAEEHAGAGVSDYSVFYKAVGWRLRVSLNDIPVVRMPGGGGERPVTNLVKNGENVLSYRAIKKDEAGPVLPLQIGIMVRRGAGLQKPAETPVDVVVTPETVGDTAEGNVHFSAGVPVRWSWQDAAVVTELVKRDEEAIIAEVQKLSRALESQDWNAYAAMRSISLDEGANYTGIPRSELLKQEVDRIQEAFPDGRFAVQMREKDEILIEPHGQVVLVTGSTEGLGSKMWVIRLTTSDDSRYALSFTDFLFCLIDGRWRIVN